MLTLFVFLMYELWSGGIGKSEWITYREVGANITAQLSSRSPTAVGSNYPSHIYLYAYQS